MESPTADFGNGCHLRPQHQEHRHADRDAEDYGHDDDDGAGQRAYAAAFMGW